MPDFRKTMEYYHGEMRRLTSVLLQGLALSLDLVPDYFEDFQTSPIATLRLLHYPAQDANPHPDEKGCGAHTDFGAITILMQDDVGGLEVWDHDEARWIAARPLKGAFIINLGDMMARWTNRRYRSTIHRVINRSGCERYSVPFFFSGNPAHVVACLDSCLGGGEQPQFAPITVMIICGNAIPQPICATSIRRPENGRSVKPPSRESPPAFRPCRLRARRRLPAPAMPRFEHVWAGQGRPPAPQRNCAGRVRTCRHSP